jgi:tetratricopeptide (TPR) repeat protein
MLYTNKKDFSLAADMFKIVFDRRCIFQGEHHVETSEVQHNYAAALMHLPERRFEAEKHLTECYSNRASVLGEAHEDTLDTLYNLASVQRSCGKFDESEASYKRLLEAATRVYGPTDLKTVSVMSSLTGLYTDVKKYGPAEALLKRVLLSQSTLLGATHSDTMATAMQLGAIVRQRGEDN